MKAFHLEDFDDDSVDQLDEGGKDQTAYHQAVAEYERKLEERRRMTPSQVAEVKEREWGESVRRILGRAPTGEKEQERFFLMLSKTPDQVNRAIDPAGNTVLHYVANPFQTPESWDGDLPVMRDTTEKEREALDLWAEVVVQWLKADPFVENHAGITPMDLACESGPTQVEFLLCMSDLSVREKAKHIARSVFLSAAGLSFEEVSLDQVDEAILSLGTFIDHDMGALLFNRQLRSSETFREFLLSEHIQDPKVRSHIRARLLPKAQAGRL